MNRDNSTDRNSAAAAEAAPTPPKGLLMLAGTVVVVGAFIALNHALGIVDIWAAFLFLLYWGMIEKMNLAKLPNCVIGALLGLLTAYLLQTLPLTLGFSGKVIAFIAILLLVYSLIMGWLTIAINGMTMLFLTVVTIPALQPHIDFANLLIALALGIAYFGGLMALVGFIRQRASNG